jgi:hypothetical protein
MTDKKKQVDAAKEMMRDQYVGRMDGPHDELEGGINPQASPGSLEPDTLAAERTSILAGGHVGRDPESPKRIPPYETIDVTPEGTEGAIRGTTSGGPQGGTSNSQVGSTTGYLRDLEVEDLPHENRSKEHRGQTFGKGKPS